MTIIKLTIHIAIFLCYACHPRQESTQTYLLPAPSRLEEILTKGRLDVSISYNTTDYYVYQGSTRGFHYDLAKDFAEYLGVKLRITEVNHDTDTAILHLLNGKYDLLAMSITQTPERKKRLGFSQALFQTREVLVQSRNYTPIKDLSELDGKNIFIPQSAQTYKELLQHLQDSLNIRLHIIKTNRYSAEDLLHFVETGKINYTVTDENIAQASGLSMKNIDYSLKLRENLSISWAVRPDADLLTAEINTWLASIRKNGKLNYLYQRYFNNQKSVPQHTSKYALLKKGNISPFDALLKKESLRLGWDWRLLAAIVFSESQFDPEAESEIGAYGLMQIIPETAEHFQVSDYFRPDSNIYTGVSYLRYLDQYLTPYVPNPEERIKFILASYNAGPGHVLDAMRLAEKYGKDPSFWYNNVDHYILNKNKTEYYRDPLSKNGYCNGPQAYRYVERILETYNNYKNIK